MDCLGLKLCVPPQIWHSQAWFRTQQYHKIIIFLFSLDIVCYSHFKEKQQCFLKIQWKKRTFQLTETLVSTVKLYL